MKASSSFTKQNKASKILFSVKTNSVTLQNVTANKMGTSLPLARTRTERHENSKPTKRLEMRPK